MSQKKDVLNSLRTVTDSSTRLIAQIYRTIQKGLQRHVRQAEGQQITVHRVHNRTDRYYCYKHNMYHVKNARGTFICPFCVKYTEQIEKQSEI